MSIQSEIIRLQQAKSEISVAVSNKGVSIPSNTKIDEYSTYINQIVTLQESLGTIYPVGIIVPFYDNEDRSSWLVFTWERCLQSRFPVGISTWRFRFWGTGGTNCGLLGLWDKLVANEPMHLRVPKAHH